MSDLIERAKREAQLGVMSPSQAMLVHDLCAEVATLEAKLAVAREALEWIACYGDSYAEEYLSLHGSYAMFDEPASAKKSRQALKEIEQ